MPRPVKGGKSVCGWVVIAEGGRMPIAPEAWRAYGFQVGDCVCFLPGSWREPRRANGATVLVRDALWRRFSIVGSYAPHLSAPAITPALERSHLPGESTWLSRTGTAARGC